MDKAPVERDAQSDEEKLPPQDEDGYYICYRECKDGTPCRRITNVPWMACYAHFGQPPMEPDNDDV